MQFDIPFKGVVKITTFSKTIPAQNFLTAITTCDLQDVKCNLTFPLRAVAKEPKNFLKEGLREVFYLKESGCFSPP